MFVVKIDGSDPALGVDGNSLDTTSTLGDLDSLLHVTSAGVPFEDGGLGANLTRDGSGTRFVDSDAHDIIGVVLQVVGDVFGGAFNLTTTEELLGVGRGVQNDTKSGGHVSGLAIAVEVDVLSGVGATVAIDVLKLVSGVWFLVVDLVVVVGLSNLADPGTDSHELLALSLLDFEEVTFLTVLVLTGVDHAACAGLFVVYHTAFIHVGIR